MANHFWIYPTKRQDEFYDAFRFKDSLQKQFPGFHFELDPKSTGKYTSDEKSYVISVYDQDKDTFYFAFELWSKFPFIDDSESRMELIDNLDKKNEDLADRVLTDMEEKENLMCIEVRRTFAHKQITLIERWIRQYFQAITMDEGIYPEILLPISESESYSPLKEKGFIKKFGDWLSK